MYGRSWPITSARFHRTRIAYSAWDYYVVVDSRAGHAAKQSKRYRFQVPYKLVDVAGGCCCCCRIPAVGSRDRRWRARRTCPWLRPSMLRVSLRVAGEGDGLIGRHRPVARAGRRRGSESGVQGRGNLWVSLRTSRRRGDLVLTHRILKSKTGIGLQLSTNLPEQTLVQEQYDVHTEV